MKKLLSSFFILGLFFVMAWGVAAWYFGANAEVQLKTFLSEKEKIQGKRFFRFELLEYNKTLLGAKARLWVSSDSSFINQRIGGFELEARQINGPVFLNNSFPLSKMYIESENGLGVDSNIDPGVLLGTTSWRLSIDESTLEPSEAEYIHSIFPAGLPVATIRIDFENRAHYQLKLNTSFAEALISGVYNLDSADNQGKVLMSNIRYGVAPNVLTAEQALIRYQHQRGITPAYKPGTTRLSATNLILNHELLEKPLNLNLSAKAEIQSNSQQVVTESDNEIGDLLNGLIELDLEQKSTEYLPVEIATLKLQFDNIPAQGFVVFSEARARQDNLRQQIQWTLEESAELPEGQDHIWELRDQLQTIQHQLPEQLAKVLFVSKDNQIQVSIKAGKNSVAINSPTGVSTDEKNEQKSILKGSIGFSQKIEKPTNLIGLLKGEAQVNLADDLYEFLKFRAGLKKASFKLGFKNGELEMH